jgi:hypothetical protein
MCHTEVGIELADSVRQGTVESRETDAGEELRVLSLPGHPQSPEHTPGHDLVDHALNEGGADQLAAPK